MSCALAMTVAAGLASRRYPLPGVFAEHLGDGLYAVAVFFGLALLAPARSGRSLAWLAFCCSAVVEFSQLLQFDWLRGLREMRIGHLVLGFGFKPADLLAYAIGALAAYLLDGVFRSDGR